MSMQSKRQIETLLGQDEFVCRIVHRLDDAVDQIPHSIEIRLAEIRARVLQSKFGTNKTVFN